MSADPPRNVHATALRIAGVGLLLRGASRSGKSALALSVLRRAGSMGLSAVLVADDQVFLELEGAHVAAVAPASIAGLIEVSGVGILREAHVARARLGLVVDLVEPELIQRMPEDLQAELLGVTLRRIALPARQAAFGADVLVSLLARGPAGLSEDALA